MPNFGLFFIYNWYYMWLGVWGKNVKAAASKFSPHPYEKNVGRFETGNSFFEAGSCLRTNRK